MATLTHNQVRTAVRRACQAPSLHNSQPWRWTASDGVVDLYYDRDRMLANTDSTGRQMVISCGAALHHAQLALLVQGWATSLEPHPDPCRPDRVATLRVTGQIQPTIDELALADAMDTRRTDRLPFDPPDDPKHLDRLLTETVSAWDVGFDSISLRQYTTLIRASDIATAHRRHDQLYQDELRWWTGHSWQLSGVPSTALPSRAEHGRVGLGRIFPPRHKQSRRPEVPRDQARVTMLSTSQDSPPEWLRCGQALSAVLLGCTSRGLATCAMTYVTEVPESRALLANLGSRPMAQVLIRIGRAADSGTPRLTRRRPPTEVLEFL